MWIQKYDPAVRFKGLDFGDRHRVKAFGGGSPVPFVGAVGADYRARVFIIWAEGLEQGAKLPWLSVDPSDFDAVVHLTNGEQRLKLFCAHWRGDGNPDELALYDTGIVWQP